MRIDQELDASGLMCPLPLLRLKKVLQSMAPGDVVRVIATDPASVLDFGVFIEQMGHQLLDRNEMDSTFVFLISKGFAN